jgi:hypothetical protein
MVADGDSRDSFARRSDDCRGVSECCGSHLVMSICHPAFAFRTRLHFKLEFNLWLLLDRLLPSVLCNLLLDLHNSCVSVLCDTFFFNDANRWHCRGVSFSCSVRTVGKMKQIRTCCDRHQRMPQRFLGRPKSAKTMATPQKKGFLGLDLDRRPSTNRYPHEVPMP